MSQRRFADDAGDRWEIRVRGKGDWEFRPIQDNKGSIHHCYPPHHATDPYELSEQELQVILDDGTPAAESGGVSSPFRDDDGKLLVDRPGGSLFEDYKPTKPRSPFLDDRE